MSKILIIEDEDNIRKLIRYDLNRQNYEVHEASDGVEGYHKAKKENFDVLLVDWMLPKMQGIRVIEQLKREGNLAIMIMVSAKSDELDILEAFEAGVDDYITKPFSPRVLSAKIAAHLKRKPKEEYFEVGNMEVNCDLRSVYVDKKLVVLTKLEFDLLVYFVKHVNQVLSRDQILQELWSFSYDGDSRIVDVHVAKLRHKLKNATAKIQVSRGIGYCIVDEKV